MQIPFYVVLGSKWWNLFSSPVTMFSRSHHSWQQHVVEAPAMIHPSVPICTHPSAVSKTNENNTDTDFLDIL
jgi:hypothetical protein